MFMNIFSNNNYIFIYILFYNRLMERHNFEYGMYILLIQYIL